MLTKTRQVLLAVLIAVVAAFAPAFVPATAFADDSWAAYSVPEVSAAAAIVVDRTTGAVLMEKNADEQRAPASTTKVMTALLVLEKANLDDTVTIEESDLEPLTWDSSRAGVIVGETYTVRDLLACLLVPSGNDAAYALARYVAGDWVSFVDLMNAKAAELGCTGTHFANPSGLDADDHYTTARDLVLIMEAALEQPEFTDIAGATSWDLPATGYQDARTLKSTDLLLDPESTVYMDGYVTAAKTGYTSAAGRCLVASAEEGTMDIVGAVLGATNTVDENGVAGNFRDLRSLLKWALTSWKTEDVLVAGTTVGSIDVGLSKDGDEVGVVSDATITATVPIEAEDSDISYEVSWTKDDSLTAPVEEGATVGTVKVLLAGSEIASASASVAKEMRLSYAQYAINWLSEPTHMVVAVVAVVAVLVVVGLAGSALSRWRRARRRAKGKIRYGVTQNRAQVMTEVKPGHMRGDEGGRR